MKILVTILLGLIAVPATAQTWNEWFRQKRTQIRYHLRQIAALQVYIELGQKGYGIYQDGLQLIGDIKDSDFGLHKNYFASLSNVNPRVSQLPNAREISVWRQQVIIFGNRIRKMQLGVSQSSLDHLFAELAKKSNDHHEQLELLVTAGNYQLSDEERITQIAKLHKAQQQLYNFAKSTYQDAIVYAKHQGKSAHEIKVIKQLQDLP